jgi:hypothetical protein
MLSQSAIIKAAKRATIVPVEKGHCPACGKTPDKLIEVKIADDDGVTNIYICKTCAMTIGAVLAAGRGK